MAAKLLIECGMDAEEAIQKVREAREGAIETLEQEVYICALCTPESYASVAGFLYSEQILEARLRGKRRTPLGKGHWFGWLSYETFEVSDRGSNGNRS